MQRQPGYYWVKYEGWVPMFWDGMFWTLRDIEIPIGDSEINETRIPSPDEQQRIINAVGRKATVDGLVVPEFEAYTLLKHRYEAPPEVNHGINFFISEEHRNNYRKLNPDK